MTDVAYRESLAEWLGHIELVWVNAREKLKPAVEEEDLKDWERELTFLIAETESLDAMELYNRSDVLQKNMEGFFHLAGLELERQEEERIQPVPIGGHRLPPLPYRYSALEPVIAEEIMRLHHTKHHQSYVGGLNKAEREMKKARDTGDFALIKHWEREAAFHGSGHYLHTIFWSIMSPDGGGKPGGKLAEAINASFGSFDKFKRHFSEAAKNVEAVGWAILVWAPRSHRLEILTAEKHQNLTQWDNIPLLVLDVWEHAYYLQYKNERAKYVDNWWNIVNWKEVERRFNQARVLRWEPF
jgi:superoxide dismutase, Fe-Mn family